jgi:hypothetical protein
MFAVIRATCIFALLAMLGLSVCAGVALAQLKLPNGAVSSGALSARANTTGLENAPLKPSPGTWQPQAVSNVPYQLQLLTSQGIVTNNYLAQDKIPTGETGLSVGNPSITIAFSVVADTQGCLYPNTTCKNVAVGWKGNIYADVCVTSADAALYPGAVQQSSLTPLSSDPACPAVTTPTGTTQRNWYQIAQASSDLYVVQNGIARIATVPLSVNLRQIRAILRFRTTGNEYDYRAAHSGPNSLTDMQKDDCPNSVIQCSPPMTDYISPSFPVVILPAALVQLKVLPVTILYLPPGDKSSANYTVLSSFSSAASASQGSEIDSSNSNDNWFEEMDTTQVSAEIGKLLNFGYTDTSDTRWDNKTTLGAGQSQVAGSSIQTTTSTMIGSGVLGGATNVPGQGGSYANAPFWNDDIFVLVHPQYAVWNFYGKTSMQLIAANSGPSPMSSTVSFTVRQLDACAHGEAPSQARLQFPIINGTETLTASECLTLAQLDPFYGKGQSADLTARGQVLSEPLPFGIVDAASAQNQQQRSVQQTESEITTTSYSSTATYSSTVEDILATSTSQGLSVGASSGNLMSSVSLSVSNSFTLKQGSNSDTSNSLKVTYSNSNATGNTTQYQATGTVSDDTWRGYTSYEEPYQDAIFGTLMFRDLYAPCASKLPCSAGLSASTLLHARLPQAPVAAKSLGTTTKPATITQAQ